MTRSRCPARSRTSYPISGGTFTPAASLGSYIRSAARATYSAYRSVPIRWRLAGGSAALTFVILAGFAAIVGTLTNRQVRTQFNDQQSSAINRLYQELNTKLTWDPDDP